MQLFESHIPFMLQLFQDYEISGMGWIDFDWKNSPELVSFRQDFSGKYSGTVSFSGFIPFPTSS